MKILITGGAGFIGSHLALRLVGAGHEVTVLDSLSPQIHGDDPANTSPLYQSIVGKVQFLHGSVCDDASLRQALTGQEAVVHLAAETGTGQSMYEIRRYSDVNISGTAALMDYLVNCPESKIERVIVASSRSIYGEGSYACTSHGQVYPGERSAADMKAGQFEPRCPICGEFVTPLATDESCPLSPSSFYGLTKRVQEEMVLMFARARGIRGVALRYQNVYGPGQSLKNPYTGILAVFSNLARVGKPIQVFEDGLESRDFVYIDDVVTATCNALLQDDVATGAYNVGAGVPVTVQQVAQLINQYFGGHSSVKVSGAFRIGDIRHNFADLSRAQQALGFSATWQFQDGLQQFLNWAQASEQSESGAFERSLDEMKSRGLLHG